MSLGFVATIWMTYRLLEYDRHGKQSSLYAVFLEDSDETFENREGSGVFGHGQILFPAVTIS